VPKGCAHGYLTLESNTVVLYYVSNYYDKKQSKGIRYDDPILNIKWPIKPKIISSQDKSWPLLKK
jgi:dTDP-4-dehydrorhamnose 3,5-epimerase